MAKTPKEEPQDERAPIPFDDALRQILKAPPANKVAAKKPQTKDKKKAR